MLRRFLYRIRAYFRTNRIESDLEKELRFHLDMAVEENLRRGMSEDEARRAAQLSFGGLAQTKERYREQARFRMLEDLRQDLGNSFRMMKTYPGFTLLTTLTLAIGIGANTAIFSIVDGVLLRPLAYRDPERLVKIVQTKINEQASKGMISIADFYDWKKQSRSFDGMAALANWSFRVTGGDFPEEIQGQNVSAEIFDVLGTRVQLGRSFRPDDEAVAILTHGYWKERFAGDPTILGKSITLNGTSHTIIGVLPERFRESFSRIRGRSRIWAMSQPSAAEAARHGTGAFMVIARLKPNVTLEQAQADMSDVAGRLAKDYPGSNTGLSATVYSLHEEVTKDSRPPLLILLSSVALVLLIVSANVAGLTLIKGLEREREFAIRTALGADRGRLARQVLSENLFLAASGGMVGFISAYWLVQAIVPLIPANVPRTNEITVDWRTFLFTASLSLLTGMLSSLSPILHGLRVDLNEALKEGSRMHSAGRRRRYAQNSLVIMQFALTLVLLYGAGLFVNSLVRFYRVDPGFDTQDLLSTQVSLRRSKGEDPNQWNLFWNQLQDQVRALPGVRATAYIQPLPLGDSNFSTPIQIEESSTHLTSYSIVSANIFDFLGIRLLQGRGFESTDRADAPGVIVVNETFARTYFPGKAAVGKQILIKEIKRMVPATIIGIAADSRMQFERLPQPHLYRLDSQYPSPSTCLLVRTSLPTSQLAQPLQSAVLSLNREQPVSLLRSMDDIRDAHAARFRFYLFLLGSFALVTLMLSAIGIYGVLSHAVRQRSHEIGIRMALGANASDVLKLIMRQGLGLLLAGLGMGLLLTFFFVRVAGKFTKALLFDVSPTDALTIGAVVLMLSVLALLASFIPGWRATKIDPLVSLRCE